MLLSTGAAVVSLLAASSCCLPLAPFVFAAGTAGASVMFASLRPYLLAISILSIGLGFVFAARARSCNRRPRLANLALLWFAAVVVLVSIVFPQFVANLLAG